MRILVLGAAGRTGREVVGHALERDHEVTALVHQDPGDGLDPRAVRVSGDATDADLVGAAVAGHDAVVDTVGGTKPYRRGLTLESDVAAVVLAAMREHHVHRLLTTSSLGVGDSLSGASPLLRVLVRTYLRGSTRDKAAMERRVRASGLDWTVVRPAVLTDGPRTGRVHVVDPSTHERARPLARADLAAWLVAQVDGSTYLRQTVTLAG